MNFVEELRWRGMVHTMMPGTEELLEKVLSQCSNITSLSYRSGLLGIGTGVEWLFQQGFLCGSRLQWCNCRVEELKLRESCNQ